MTQMRVDIDLRREQLHWEPWKLPIAAFAAGAGLMGALVAITARLLRSSL